MRLRYILLLVSLLTSTFLTATCVTSVNFNNSGPYISPLYVYATAVSTCPIRSMQVYIDGRLQFVQYNQNSLQAYLLIPPGNHYISVKAWTGDGTSALSGPLGLSVGDLHPPDCVPKADSVVRICAPENLSNNNYLKDVIYMKAAATSAGDPVKRMRAFVDGSLSAETFAHNGAQIFYFPPAKAGIHRVTIEAITESNRSFQNQASVNVVSVSPSCETPILSSLSPTSGDTSQFPVFLAAADAALFCHITGFRVYVDDRTQYTQYGQGVLTGRLTIPQGPHRVVLQAWNNQGGVNQKAININVTESPEVVCVPESDPGVTICGTEYLGSGYLAIFVGTSPTPQQPYAAVRLYVDDVARAQFTNDAVARGISSLKMSPGRHRIVAVAWTKDGTAVTAKTEVDVPPPEYPQ